MTDQASVPGPPSHEGGAALPPTAGEDSPRPCVTPGSAVEPPTERSATYGPVVDDGPAVDSDPPDEEQDSDDEYVPA